MNTPPLLLGVTLLFWGWHCGLLGIAVLLALALEGSRFVTARWELTQTDLDRIWNLSTVLFFGAVVIAFASDDGAGSIAGLFAQNTPAARVAALAKGGRSLLLILHWMPITLFPIAAAQAYSTRTQMDWSTFSWWLRRMRGREETAYLAWRGGLNVTWPYFAATLTAASAAKQGQPFFFAGAAALLAWALWPRRPRSFSAATWGACLLAVIALGHGGQLGLVKLRQTIEELDTALVSRLTAGQANGRETQTRIGSIGQLKLSGTIVMRVTAESNAPPELLREASFNLFKAPHWAASRRNFTGVTSERDGTTWILASTGQPPRALIVASLLPGGTGLLAVPHGVTRLEQFPAALETNRYGTVRANNGPGYVEFRARYQADSAIDSPPDAEDLECALEERPALARVANELDLARQTPERALATVANFFADRFRYSTWLSEEHRVHSNRTALAAFLLEHRSGHCEYFATATTLLLRQAGIPARYAVGYSVQERKGATYIIRQRHGHAWCLAWVNNGWREVDNTPPSWHDVEGGHSSFWEPLGDLWSRFKFAFSKWRWSEGGFKKYLVWLVVPLVLLLAARLFFKRQWNRSRTPTGPAAPPVQWPGRDSDFYRIEATLREAGLERRRDEPLAHWLKRAEAARLIEPSELDAALTLHYRLRFDPARWGADSHGELRGLVEAWAGSRTAPKRT